MTDTKTIGISALITLLIIAGATIGPTFFDTPKYYCQDESSIMECPGDLSGGSGTRCYLNTEKNSWDYCSSGWELITDDRPIQEEAKDEPVEQSTDTIGVWGKQYSCDQEGCIEI